MDAENVVPSEPYSTPSVPSTFKLKKYNDDDISPMSNVAETPVIRGAEKTKGGGGNITFAEEIDREAEEEEDSSSDEVRGGRGRGAKGGRSVLTTIYCILL